MEDLRILMLVSLVVVLPIIPAYILYKSLPARTTVSGPFKGLTIQLKGAFAGYFLVALLTSGFITGYSYTKPQYELWTIEGTVKLEEQKPVEGIIFTIKPPHQDLSPDGHFVIDNVPLEKMMTVMPDLIIQKGGYATETVNLREENPRYKVSYDKNLKKIAIGNDVVLQNLQKAPKYDQEKGEIPKPVQ
jgi:hypothetical protein